jgi:hypothetical protein
MIGKNLLAASLKPPYNPYNTRPRCFYVISQNNTSLPVQWKRRD